MARPIASVLSAMPGPELDVTPSAPAYDAPIAAQIAAISSSAWKVSTPWLFRFASTWSRDVAGVMGYEPKNSCGRPAAWAPASRPHAVASVPVTVR